MITKVIKIRLLALLLGLMGLLILSGCNDTSVTRPMDESLFAPTAELRARQLTDISYNLEINIDAHGDQFSGVAEISFTLIPDNTDDLTIDFHQGSVASITRNGEQVNYLYEKWFITVPAEELEAGENTLVVTYQHPYATDGSGLHRFVDPEDGEVYMYTDFEPYDANRLFPHFDQPDLKAIYRLKVTAPQAWQVISATRETAIEPAGVNNIWRFPPSAKISSYVFPLHAGNYAMWQDQFEDIPLRLFARQSIADYVVTEEWFTPTKQSFGFFNQYFDLRYPFGKYDQIIVPDFNAGAMENVAAVTFNEVYIERSEKSTLSKMRLTNVIAHEMAHMWFGDLVTMRWWNGLWLNESFATYMANLEVSSASDFENNWDVFYARTKQWAYRTDNSVNTHGIELPVASTGEAMSNFDGITYGKGASVLKQLPYYLGEENFRLGVSNYIKKYAYKNTDLDDFITELSLAAEMDMTQWTQDWLYQAGLNTIKVSYQCDNNGISQLSINQSAPQDHPTLREQRVQIGFYQLEGSVLGLSSALPVTYSGATTDIKQAIGMACPDLVYPNEADWGYVKVDLDKRSLATAQSHINGVENITMRLMLWQSLIDSVRDAKLSPEQFARFAIANISGETNSNVARTISGGLNSAMGYLGTATRLGRGDFRDLDLEVEALYLRLLSNAEPGSDLQKLWYANTVSSAKSPAQLALLVSILQGEQQFEGLVIDQSKRWSLVAALNRYQYGDFRALLNAEMARDNSDAGAKSAVYSKAIRPDAATKAKWFEVLMDNPDNLKLSALRYIMSALFPAEQVALEMPYKERILALIPALNNNDDLGFTRAFAGTMLPAQCTAQSEQELGLLIEKVNQMKPIIVKAVKASHESVERCIKVLETL